MKPTKSAGNGFTLVEILFVFVVISLLFITLLPSIRKMKEKGRETVCIANQRQLAVAAILYANEAMSMLPVSIVKAMEFNHSAGDEFHRDTDTFLDSSAYAQSVISMPVYYNHDYGLTRCPEVSGSILDTVPTYSYGLNIYVAGRQIENIKDAASTLMLSDSIFEGISSSSEVAFRHGSGCAFAAYVDGHIGIFHDVVPAEAFAANQ